MKAEKGLAYCGLACCVCSENGNCVGCRKDGCKDKEWCKSFNCCKEKGIYGCWECKEFPCENKMLNKLRVRAFSRFIAKYGEEKLMECLKHNEENGMLYHYENELVGDYDKPNTEEEVIQLILQGKCS